MDELGFDRYDRTWEVWLDAGDGQVRLKLGRSIRQKRRPAPLRREAAKTSIRA